MRFLSDLSVFVVTNYTAPCKGFKSDSRLSENCPKGEENLYVARFSIQFSGSIFLLPNSMQITSKKINAYTVEIVIKDSAKAFEKAREETLADIAANVSIKGFRKGSAPKDAVLREYGEVRITEQSVNSYLDKQYHKILEKTGALPVAPGVVKAIKSVEPLEIVLEIEILPEAVIDEKKLSKISVAKTGAEATEADAEKAFFEIEKRFTHYHDAGTHGDDGFDASKAVIEKGDRVTIDTQGFDKQGGSEIVETKVKAFPLVIGSGQFIPGFEDQLIGRKVGEVAEFEITFPKDYHAEAFKGRKVFFVTTVFKLEKPHKPEWTEEFIERLRGVKTDVPGFKEVLRKEILAEREREARMKDEAALLEKLQEITELELGSGIVERETDMVWREQKGNLEAQGYTVKDYLSHLGKDEVSYKKETLEPEARRRLSAELILKKIREIKGIEATEDEIKIEVNTIISAYSSEQVKERLKTKLVPGDTHYEDIKNRLAYRKVVDLFLK
ncbi:MAG: Trigger factor [Patescibacteria group bacterium]|nr:Trigger factor [Patescibacteria group bacterium]